MLHSAETSEEQKELLRSRLTRSFVVLQCDKKGLLHLSAKPALLRVASGTSSTAALLPTSFDEVRILFCDGVVRAWLQGATLVVQ